MDPRLKQINALISGYSQGNFDKHIKISDSLDEIDGIATSVNMLGEELKAVMISRNYFTNIFNAVTDIVLVVNKSGVIEDANHAADVQCKFEKGYLKGKPLNILMFRGIPHFRKMLAILKERGAVHYESCRLKTALGNIIPVKVNIVYFEDGNRKHRILLTATDISYRIRTENLVIRAMIDTQEQERIRLAKDLHDSLIQQMSGIKFFISTTAGLTKDKGKQQVLQQANTAMADMITDVRNICFNLMPRSLEEFGLVKAVEVFCDSVVIGNNVKFDIREEMQLPPMLSSLNIDLYRVIQEFIHNAIVHGKADQVSVVFRSTKNMLSLKLRDNGCGFDLLTVSNGMGLKNVESRVRSHDGKFELTSVLGKGTTYKINIPLN
ncbi:PAS domain-containing sensor histidine kinase [Ferruginibacter sp.]